MKKKIPFRISKISTSRQKYYTAAIDGLKMGYTLRGKDFETLDQLLKNIGATRYYKKRRAWRFESSPRTRLANIEIDVVEDYRRLGRPRKMSNGGIIETHDGKKGGTIEGKTHAQGGVDAVVITDNNRPVELEEGEGVLSANTMKGEKKYLFEGEKLTAKEIASKLNVDHGGRTLMEKGGVVKEEDVLVEARLKFTGNDADHIIDYIDPEDLLSEDIEFNGNGEYYLYFYYPSLNYKPFDKRRMESGIFMDIENILRQDDVDADIESVDIVNSGKFEEYNKGGEIKKEADIDEDTPTSQMTYQQYVDISKKEYAWKNNEAIRQAYKLSLLREIFDKEIAADNMGTNISRFGGNTNTFILNNISKVKIENQTSYQAAEKNIKELIEKAIFENKQLPDELLKDYPNLKKQYDYIREIPITINQNDLDYEVARRAHYATSFSPEKRAVQHQKDYVRSMINFWLTFSPLAKNERQKEILAERMTGYKDVYLKFMKDYLYSHANVMSAMITGPANFPVRQNEKANRAADNKMNTFIEKTNKFKNNTRKMLNEAKTKEQKASEVKQVIKNRLDDGIQTIIEIDTGVNNYSSRPLFVQNLQGYIERMAKNGRVEDVKYALNYIKERQKDMKKPVFAARNSIWNAVEIAKSKVQSLEDKKENPEEVEYIGAKIVRNYDDDRIQIFFDEIPAPEIRAKLKSKAFKWSPRNKAWQRKNTIAGYREAVLVVNEFFKKKEQEKKPFKKKAASEKLIGGVADNKTLKEIAEEQGKDLPFTFAQLKKGIKVEMEHTNDPEKAKEIAFDHLYENLNYYIELEKMEKKLEDKPKQSEKAKIQAKIDGFKVLLELADTEAEKEKLQAKIEGFEVLLDIN
jgi:hypothetical protein